MPPGNPWLPDFSWSKHTKMEKIYQMTTNYTKLPYIMPNGHKIFQTIITAFSKAMQNLPKLGFLVWKQTIWQPCGNPENLSCWSLFHGCVFFHSFHAIRFLGLTPHACCCVKHRPQCFWVSDPLCLYSSSALHFFQLFFLGPTPCLTGWPASPCTCNGLWLLSRMAAGRSFSNSTLGLNFDPRGWRPSDRPSVLL
jgi:hypothetical protein